MEQSVQEHPAKTQIFPFSEKILSVLLLDRTIGKNILWATDDYAPINAKSQIQLFQITGTNSERIKPRIQKQKKEQQNRIYEIRKTYDILN